ncbi:bifunctional hydroxymethylpyrimidine kinase/phosphomethylpyrimidine kinase [Thiolapillus brandeum]|uniref:hydroxymethylpyrimidine kinase n=1 Tax=Thiolapillus brandeum TaxID=1076588 RepID=A0A7U6GGG6_9GAMM|nr:hydroxymethylpyrimidine/phosphomethylpyrimidine kinase [Thiolapillus brandeum]BAO43153.1 phosphomethylpyrimidine kinase [Thiolapillus brandeum]
MTEVTSSPVVLCISGLDPSGGAGIQADIETLAANGCHAAALITCLTEQDSRRVYRVHPVAADILRQQAQRIIHDYPVAAIKVGLVGDARIAAEIHSICEALPDVPLVLDTVLASGSGQAMSSTDMLLPLLEKARLITPNRREARALSGRTGPEDCAHSLMKRGCGAILITGADESSHGQVTNSLYQEQQTRHWQWPKLPGSYHGSGCTLASAIAGGLARGQTLDDAVDAAQNYTWHALDRAFHPGKGQFIPGRYPCIG